MLEIITHIYWELFLKQLNPKQMKKEIRDLEATLHKAVREQSEDLISILEDSICQCTGKRISTHKLDALLHRVF